jgi:Flp pilus assembly protein TadG
VHSGWRSDRGTVTAEFALLLPVLVAVLILAVGALSLVSMQIGNTVSVGEWARSLARGGDLSTIVQQVERSKPGAQASMVTGDGVLCLKLSETVTLPLWSSLIPRLEVSSCVPIP